MAPPLLPQIHDRKIQAAHALAICAPKCLSTPGLLSEIERVKMIKSLSVQMTFSPTEGCLFTWLCLVLAIVLVVFKNFTKQNTVFGKAQRALAGFKPHSAIVLPHWPTSQGAGSIGCILTGTSTATNTFCENLLCWICSLLPSSPPVPKHLAEVRNRKSGSLTQMLPRICVLCGLEAGSAGSPHEKAAVRVAQPHYTGNSERPSVTLCTTPFSCSHREESCDQL